MHVPIWTFCAEVSLVPNDENLFSLKQRRALVPRIFTLNAQFQYHWIWFICSSKASVQSSLPSQRGRERERTSAFVSTAFQRLSRALLVTAVPTNNPTLDSAFAIFFLHNRQQNTFCRVTDILVVQIDEDVQCWKTAFWKTSTVSLYFRSWATLGKMMKAMTVVL